ncbi:terminase [Humibacillus xanthopallidus]|uniref:terminase n=1 Tax=Humibacillus xanthopallidus TaxID=412689 RepID=UPI001C895259|nr:terminase [Humibacillus xanthopallidus]
MLSDYELAEHELQLLARACRVADTCSSLQATVDTDGPLTTSRLGEQRAHPALVELRQQSALLARLIVALRVPIGEQEMDTQRTRRRATRGVYRLGSAS